MAEITEDGYTYIKLSIMEDCTYVGLRDSENDTGTRIKVSDPRIEWTYPTKEWVVDHDRLGSPITEDVPAEGALTLKVIVKGSDAGFALPQEFSIVSLQDDEGRVISEETFDTFVMESDDDTLTIVHTVEVPQVTP